MSDDGEIGILNPVLCVHESLGFEGENMSQ